MSSLYTDRIRQKDNILKKYLILSKNYKNRYIKQKQLQSKTKSKRINQNKSIMPKKIVPLKISENNSVLLSKNNNNKNEIINGGININNSSEFNFSKYDKNDNINEIKYNNYSENIYKVNNLNKYEYINQINGNYTHNLKKYINSYQNNTNKESDFLNKKYYMTEKIPSKINIHQLTRCLNYLKLNKSSSYDNKKGVKYNYLGQKLNTIPYENKSYYFSILSKETREQFSFEKNRTKKFSNLIEEDNILLNYYPINKNKIDTFTINSNQIDYINNKGKEKEKNKSKESSIKEIIIFNPNTFINKNKYNNEFENNININMTENYKKETTEEQKENNNNSKQFIKFKANLKKRIETETSKKNDKFKISVKVKRLALGLENHFKNRNYNKTEDKENGIKLSKEKIKIKIPISSIYIKKRTQNVFENNKM